jgi:hypothetical protein
MACGAGDGAWLRRWCSRLLVALIAALPGCTLDPHPCGDFPCEPKLVEVYFSLAGWNPGEYDVKVNADGTGYACSFTLVCTEYVLPVSGVGGQSGAAATPNADTNAVVCMNGRGYFYPTECEDRLMGVVVPRYNEDPHVYLHDTPGIIRVSVLRDGQVLVDGTLQLQYEHTYVECEGDCYKAEATLPPSG